jgi:hypothetical protein
MDAQELRALQEAYMEVYRELDEDWKPVNVPKVKSRMGNLEGRLSSVSNDRFSSNTPEYARYQRTADVVSQSTRNPNKPFQKPTPDPGGMKIKPGGGVTSSPERNSQWQPFSSRLPTKTPATVTKPSGGGMGGARGGGSSPGSVKPAAKPSTPSSTTPNPRSISGSSAPRPGRGSTSNWMTDRMGEFTSSLNRLSKPNSTTKPQVKPTKSSRGGGSSAQGLGSSSGTRGYQVGGSPGYGISGIKLADSYDLYDIILSHLLDEGYADTQEAAEAIMVNMSEDWRESIILEQSLPSNYTDYKSPAVQASHARSMGSASRMRQMGMNATSVDPKDDAQSNLNAVKSGNGVAKPLSGTTIKSGAGKGFKVGDPGIDIGPSK